MLYEKEESRYQGDRARSYNSPETLQLATDIYERRIHIAIASKNWESAREIIAEAEADAERPVLVSPLLDTPLSDTDIPMKILNSLDSVGVHYIGDLANTTCTNLMSVRGFGQRSVDIVWQSVLKLSARRDNDRAVLAIQSGSKSR